MKLGRKEETFVCQITAEALAVLKLRGKSGSRKELCGIEAEPIAADKSPKAIASKLAAILKKLEYKDSGIILSLPRNEAICRYIKVPAELPQEIEKIISLQAQTYLPYSTNELITAYQKILTDKEGYSHLGITVAHKDIIERYISILNELKIGKFGIILSSYGLAGLYCRGARKESSPVMLIEINRTHVELAVASAGKLIFSRYFTNNESLPEWEGLFVDEINITLESYMKEAPQPGQLKMVVLGEGEDSRRYAGILKQKTGLVVERFSYESAADIKDESVRKALGSRGFCISLLGLGLFPQEDSLNLLPAAGKEELRRKASLRRNLRLLYFGCAIFIVSSLAWFKNMDNKAAYLKSLKAELGRLESQAKPLEDMEKRFKILEGHGIPGGSSLNILYELHRVFPEQTTLANFRYDDDGSVSLRGEAKELNSIFELVSRLEKTDVFRGYSVKVRYATKRSTTLGEIVDFEIICSKK